MSEPTLSNQQTNPDQAVISSEQAQPMAPTNASGSAMLDAHAAVGEAQPEGDPVEYPVATNFSTASASGDAKTADVATVSGTFTADQASEQGQVNLQNNPDTPGEGMQGTLPNTDPVGMPLDPDTNIEE
ncbi:MULTISPECIES: hypothetical protein [Cyanophyceae]|uniref:hypothetical protein n=1 Tax=Cyanophyceae TaxID=3028117 RepID=UPI001688A03E|nr:MULTISPECIES: hypothetical protein [Cyanophyceae]MBD1917845.1 hypothetical protein [Phormidium sp. FACHB-77]MBD2032963.1 hypothetical protein [Phormidium sp. FACHB-322]MBD2051711.1 hypothetical protein [Leptolyngbya sp. FACHB-60]